MNWKHSLTKQTNDCLFYPRFINAEERSCSPRTRLAQRDRLKVVKKLHQELNELKKDNEVMLQKQKREFEEMLQKCRNSDQLLQDRKL